MSPPSPRLASRRFDRHRDRAIGGFGGGGCAGARRRAHGKTIALPGRCHRYPELARRLRPQDPPRHRPRRRPGAVALPHRTAPGKFDRYPGFADVMAGSLGGSDVTRLGPPRRCGHCLCCRTGMTVEENLLMGGPARGAASRRPSACSTVTRGSAPPSSGPAFSPAARPPARNLPRQRHHGECVAENGRAPDRGCSSPAGSAFPDLTHSLEQRHLRPRWRRMANPEVAT